MIIRDYKGHRDYWWDFGGRMNYMGLKFFSANHRNFITKLFELYFKLQSLPFNVIFCHILGAHFANENLYFLYYYIIGVLSLYPFRADGFHMITHVYCR